MCVVKILEVSWLNKKKPLVYIIKNETKLPKVFDKSNILRTFSPGKNT